MRIWNSIRFLITFTIIGIISFFVCILYGTDAALKNIKNNGIILTNEENERKS